MLIIGLKTQRRRSCTCDLFVDGNGYGACTKRDKKFGNLYTCYVYSESICNDMLRSALHPELFLSAEACEDKNECMILTQALNYDFLKVKQIRVIY